MEQLKIIRNGKGFNYSVFSPNARDSSGGYHLNFNDIVSYFQLGFEPGYIIQHYNKFEKAWGFVKSKTGEYGLVREKFFAIPNLPTFLLLPDDYQPSALIRGVLLYDDKNDNDLLLPPAIPNIVDATI